MKNTGILALLITILLTVNYINAYALESKVVLTIDPNVEDKWYKIRSETAPSFSTADRVLRKQFFSVLVFFKDYKQDKNGNVNITYNVEILRPDKTQYFKQENIRGINSLVQSDRLVMMCADYMRVCFEPDDMPGEYTVTVTAKDNADNTISTQKAAITLYEFTSTPYFSNGEDLEQWMNSYHRLPSPEKAIDAFFFCVRNNYVNQDSVAPFYAFFITVFESNPYLIPYLIQEYRLSDTKIKTFILYLFAHIEYDFNSFIASLPDNEKEIYENCIRNRLPDPYGQISDASQLDMLWGIFLASGKYEAVKKIVMTLDYKNTENKKSMNYLIFGAARWSLKSNCGQFPLVRDYCMYMLETEQLTDTVRSGLTEILNGE